MIKNGKFLLSGGIVAAVAGLSLASIVPGQVRAASEFATKDGFDISKRCDATLTITDELIGSPGKIEVYGGFGGPASCSLGNIPQKATIRVRLFENGQEVMQSLRTLPDCDAMKWKWKTCSSESHQVSWPDDANKTHEYYGRMEITSFTGHVILTTRTIRS